MAEEPTHDCPSQESEEQGSEGEKEDNYVLLLVPMLSFAILAII